VREDVALVDRVAHAGKFLGRVARLHHVRIATRSRVLGSSRRARFDHDQNVTKCPVLIKWEVDGVNGLRPHLSPAKTARR
jgi:hypothetical protein